MSNAETANMKKEIERLNRELKYCQQDSKQMSRYLCGYQQICRENGCAPSSGELLEAMKRFDERTKNK